MNFESALIHLGCSEESSLGLRLPPGTFLSHRARSVMQAETVVCIYGLFCVCKYLKLLVTVHRTCFSSKGVSFGEQHLSSSVCKAQFRS